jgi:Subtilase family
LATSRHHHRALPAPGRTDHRGRALPGRVGRAALASLLAAASLGAGPASAEEVFTSQAAASNATDSTWIPAPPRRAAVCIVDTGTDITPDTTNVVARFSMDGSDGSDISPVKHGTLMATIASAPKNDFGMVGAAPSINIVSIRASRDGHTFAGLDVYAAIQLCIAKRSAYNIKVVSLSLGGDGGTVTATAVQRTEFENAIDSARLRGLNVVAAAGNSERGVVDWPAGYRPAFAVGAATDTGNRCSFASWGSEVDLWSLACPLDVARPDGTGTAAWAQGSSAATAFIAAILAQMRGLDLALNVDAAEQALLSGGSSDTAGVFLDVGSAYRVAGLEASLNAGHEAIPHSASVSLSDSATESQTVETSALSDDTYGVEAVPAVSASQTTADLSSATVVRTARRLARPVVRTATVRHGRLQLTLRGKPRGIEARVDIYAREPGRPFPSLIRRARFRSDTLRIRVSGAISQLSIGYRDPMGRRDRSEVIVVYPKV